MSTEQTSKPGLVGGGLAALGIVFGDLGTSPLYTLQTVVGDAGGKVDHEALFGSLSLLVWALVVVVTLKYATLVMKADDHGEGGILALLSIARPRFGGGMFSRGTLLTCAGLFGAALLYGDGVITPSISVLSALEGTETVTSAVKPYILPLAVLILAVLFAAQPFGTASIGTIFGPVMLGWFLIIGLLGVHNLLAHPAVLAALDPRIGAHFLITHGWGSFVVLGGVFLALTGAEALYADMGHVGRGPVRLAWFAIVFPALLLSYAGQVAFMDAHQGVQGNPFFASIPHLLVIPVVVLATFATIIASQAIITGTFTLTRQAMQLGWFPGLNIRQTSDTAYGQIYVPVVNWIMMFGTIAIAIAFKSSDKLSGAYGTAVSTTMLMTTALIFDVMRERWRWNIALAGSVAFILVLVDTSFFAANLLKIVQGGYVPLAIGFVLFTMMLVWHRGIGLIRDGLAPLGERVDEVFGKLSRDEIPRVPGSVVFLSRSESAVPPIMARYIADFRSLPEKIIVLSVKFIDQARVSASERTKTRQVFEGIWQVTVLFGFVEIPNLSQALLSAKDKGCDIDLDEVLYLAGHDDIVPNERGPRMALWQRVLFGLMYRNAVRASDRFSLPRKRLVELGHQIEV
jgi:KUP system potassium uptake protein